MIRSWVDEIEYQIEEILGPQDIIKLNALVDEIEGIVEEEIDEQIESKTDAAYDEGYNEGYIAGTEEDEED